MNNKQQINLRRAYKAAWDRVDQLQERCEEDDLLFGVVYDHRNRRWLVNCLDMNRWITERFHGGHRGYFREV